MYDWSKHKIGIVLTGGGAKGAYEIGCWKALSEQGISFTAIAGTSIGGINGYLMSLGDLNNAENVWIKMGQDSPLRFSPFRLFLVFLERLGLAFTMGLEIFVLLPLIALLGFIIILVVVGAAYLIGPDSLQPLRAILPPSIPVILLALTRRLKGTKLGRFARGGIRYSLRGARRHTRQMMPVEPAVFFGAAIGLIIPAAMLVFSIINDHRSWFWFLVLVPCLVLDILTIVLSSDPGFSSPGEISLLSTERLEELLVDHGAKDKFMPVEPRLYIARMREEIISLPGPIPEEVTDLLRAIAANKRWEDLTVQDLEYYRSQLEQLGLDEYFANSTETVIGLEYVPVSGNSVLEAADSILATSAIADVLGRVPRRVSGIEEEDLVLRRMRAEFYDPGLIDNTPIAPILEAGECDLIIVIFLDHEIKDPTKYLEDHLQQINAKIRRRNPDLDNQTYHMLEEDEKGFFLKPIQSAPSRLRNIKLIPIIPSQELGRGPMGFLRETIRFRESRIRDLINLGFKDTQRAIEQFVKLQTETA